MSSMFNVQCPFFLHTSLFVGLNFFKKLFKKTIIILIIDIMSAIVVFTDVQPVNVG